MTRKQAHRVRMRDMSDDERHKRIGARKHHTHRIVKPTSVIRRDTATKPRVGQKAMQRQPGPGQYDVRAAQADLAASASVQTAAFGDCQRYEKYEDSGQSMCRTGAFQTLTFFLV